MAAPRPVDILAARLDGAELSPAQWRAWMSALAQGEITPYQHAALQTSAVARPLSEAEAQAALQAIEAAPSPHAAGLPGLGIPDLFSQALTGPSNGDAALITTLSAATRGDTLSDDAIAALVGSVASGKASDAQVATFCAAVYLKGLSPTAVATLTYEMTHNGDVLELGPLPGPVVDKHSTGGVGDKVSLPLAAVLAACGAYVPMVSGRGLGHTGGTLDKLQSIPGFRVDLSPDEIRQAVAEVGAVIVGQTGQLAPADKRMYAIRDVTGTVSSIPLITASILSKKLAEGLEALVMDVKVGSGAFMKEEGDARTLAKSLVDVGQALSARASGGMTVRALLTGMDRPLGRMLGNALEVQEAIDCLKGGGPEDLRTLVIGIAARLLVEGGIVAALPAGVARAAAALADGTALRRFGLMIAAQGGDPTVLNDPSRLPTAPVTVSFNAPHAGFVRRMDALALGKVVVSLGGGRNTAEDTINPAVGLEILEPIGAPVAKGAPIIRVHAADQTTAAAAVASLMAGVEVGPLRPSPPLLPLIIGEA